jgi:hypothetical protein
MGGFGSGPKRESKKSLTSEFVRLDMKALRKAGISLQVQLPSDKRDPVEMELNGDDDEPLRARLCHGFETGYGFGDRDSDSGIPRRYWLSDTSLFVTLAFTRPNYGGARIWFICPRTSCARRCRVLYRPRFSNARAFACRQCHRLAYPSQRMNKAARLEARSDALGDRLIRSDGYFLRPWAMHWSTYESLSDAANEMASKAFHLRIGLRASRG